MPTRDSQADPLEASLDELFAAPLKAFVAERKRLTERLKVAGKSLAAKELAKTPRPTVSAWIANQLARQDGALLRDFGALTDRLRGAQGKTSSPSEGSASELMTEHRAALKQLRGRAEEILSGSGQAVRPAILDRVLQNLRLGMAEAKVRPMIERGRLIEDLAADDGFAGLFGLAGERDAAGPVAPQAAPSGWRGENASRARDARPTGHDSEIEARRAAAEEQRAAAEQAEARARVQEERARARGELEVRLRTLRARADGAHRSVEKAQRDVQAARQTLAQAEDDLQAAHRAAEGCANQLADAQADLANTRESS